MDRPEPGSDGGPSGELALADPAVVTLALPLEGGMPWEVSALAWPVEGAASALVLVHGYSGVKENYFHTLPGRGASLGARFALTNRTVVALDLPGYGGSQGDPNAVNFELMAAAVRETAAALRAGEQGFAPHARVSAYGLSMGAVIVNLAAADHDDLDAIVPAGFPLSPATEEGRACEADPECPEAQDLYNGEFFVPNLDWEVANATIAGYESGHDVGNGASFAAWYGPCVLSFYAPVQPPGACDVSWPVFERFVARVDVPVFTLVGDHDLPWLGSDLSEEGSYYSASPRVDTWVVPDTGHFVHNHRTQAAMVERIAAWLAEVGA